MILNFFRGDRTAHEFLKKFNNYMINYPLLCNSKDLIDKEKDFARSAESFYTEHFLIGSSIKTMFEAWGDDYDNWKDYFQRDWSIKDLAKKAKAIPVLEEFANILESENPNFERLDEIQKENPNLFDYEYISSMKSLIYDVLELLPIQLNADTEIIKMAADHIYETYESFYENGRLKQDPKLVEDDSFPTMLLKILGYEGVWPSIDCDNTTYGGVIFDLESFTYEKIADHAKDYIKQDLRESEQTIVSKKTGSKYTQEDLDNEARDLIESPYNNLQEDDFEWLHVSPEDIEYWWDKTWEMESLERNLYDD